MLLHKFIELVTEEFRRQVLDAEHPTTPEEFRTYTMLPKALQLGQENAEAFCNTVLNQLLLTHDAELGPAMERLDDISREQAFKDLCEVRGHNPQYASHDNTAELKAYFDAGWNARRK